MKFDTLAGGDPISSNSYKMEVGYSGPDTPFKGRVIQHTYINGNIDVINLGTKNEKISEFDIILLDETEIVPLQEFLYCNSGLKIKITQEYSDEAIFLENFSVGPFPFDYYAYLLEAGSYAEEQFSKNRKTFRLRVKLALAGLTSTSEINPPDTGLYNILIKVNTIQSAVAQTTLPDPTLYNPGDRWHNTTDGNVYERSDANIYLSSLTAGIYSPNPDGTSSVAQAGAFSGYTFSPGDKIELIDNSPTQDGIISGVYEIIEKQSDDVIKFANNNPGNFAVGFVKSALGFEKLLYAVPSDIPTLGYIGGSFYWAALFTMNSASFPAISLEENYLSGIINFESIQIPGQSININNGPNSSTKEGFTFSVNNADRFWKTIVDAGIPLFGANIEVSIFRDTIGSQTLQKIISAKNITNDFSYTDYKFQVEPFLLNKKQNLPITRISRDQEQYYNVRDDAVGKAPYLTYGQFNKGALQNVSKQRINVSVGRYDPPYNIGFGATTSPTTVITGSIDPTDGSIIYISNRLNSDTDYGFVIDSDVINDINANGGYTIKIISDTNSASEDNIEQVRVISSIESITNYYKITLTQVLPEIPPASGSNPPGSDERIRFLVTNATFTFQFNESPSGGFGTINGTGNFVPGDIRLFFLSDNNKDLVEIPPNEFLVNVTKNSIQFTLVGVNDPTVAVNFTRVGNESSEIFTQQLVPLTTPLRPITFSDSSGALTPPAGFTGSNHEKMWRSVINSYGVHKQYSTGYPGYDDESGPKSPIAYNAYDDFVGGERLSWINSSRYYDPLSLHPSYNSETSFNARVAIQTVDKDSGSITKYDSLDDNSIIYAFEFPVNHFSEIDNLITDGTKVVFTINMLIQMKFVSIVYPDTSTVNGFPTANWDRLENSGLTVILRARRRDGTYIYDSNWEYTFTQKEMGGGSQPPDINTTQAGYVTNTDIGELLINNNPDGASQGVFESGTSLPSDNWDYDVDFIFSTTIQRDSAYSTNQEMFGVGVRAFITSSNKITVLREKSGSPNVYEWADSVASVPNSSVVRFRDFIRAKGDLTPPTLQFLIWDSGALSFSAATEGVDYNARSSVSGRDLFDVSKLFTNPQDWPDVEAFEILLVNSDMKTDINSSEYDDVATSILYWYRYQEPYIELINGPFLYKVDEFNVEDRPMFSAIQGKTLVGQSTFPPNPGPIIKDILTTMFPGKVNLASIDTLMSQSNRANWLWRRQFTSAMKSDEVIKELLDNLWAVMVVDEDDNIKLLSLNPDDYEITSPNQEFTDDDIIKDSISNPKFRKTDEIFQRFELDYNFDPVSEFSESTPEFRNSDLLADVPQSSASTQLKTVMRNSNILYNVFNIFKAEYKYHYSGNTLPLRDWVVNHYAYNAWTVKLEGSIDRIIGAGALKLMSLVSLNSYFFTGGDSLVGFITKIEPDVYNAKCVFTVFIPRPLGYLGPLCDPFKDAGVVGRNLSAYVINDAGTTGRSTGSFQKDDAGDSPRGTIEC